MNKKYIAILGVLFTAMMATIVTLAVVTQSNAKSVFTEAGYILTGEDDKQESFLAQTTYKLAQTGYIEFENDEGDSVILESTNFVYMEDDSVMALNDGVILDFSDLSSNFINNYYTTEELSITEIGAGQYSIASESGTIELGEYLWKLSDDKYLICANTLSVYFSDDDIREVDNYVEINITEDGIVQMLTEENIWMTISEQTYIETEGGIIINPVSSIIDDGTYQITTSKLVVSADDNIVLTEDETYRQIVPQIEITTIDGEDGTDGESGSDGTSGADGEGGESGDNGEVGDTGDEGESGTSGSSGVNGATGTKGVDSTVSSSTNTALPTMTLIDWNVTQTSLSATIEVSGGAEALDITNYDEDKHGGSIIITNAATGEVIYCYETDALYNIKDSDPDYTIIDFTTAVDVSFSTMDDPLEADTAYVLSVVAFYELNDVVYSREFISRTFYTDSSGIQIVHTASEVDSATLEVSSTDAVGSVTLYALTAQQNESFSTSNLTSSDYEDMVQITFDAMGTETIEFDGLSSDSEYIVRAVVNGVISSQTETFTTLKEAPTWDTATVPTVYYDRVSGAFEVYRPTVVDNDSGVEKYVYSAYNTDGELMYSKTVYPSDAEPVSFTLDSGTYYYFTVEMYFDDNEKVVTYDLGSSSQIKSEGDTLPKVSWTDTTDSSFNDISGAIQIALGSNSTMTVSETDPITVVVYADQVIDFSLDVFGGSNTVLVDRYALYYDDNNSNSNYEIITVELDSLLKNTNYTVTVYGYIDLNDGNGAQYRELGTVSLRTETTNSLLATVTTSDSGSNAINEVLTMSIVADTDSSTADEEYVYKELLEGKVTVELYKGTGNTRTLLGSTNITGSDLEEIYDNPNGDKATGYTITEENFNLGSLDSDSNYTLVISEVTDVTYNMTELGYTNTFDEISPSSKVITATPTPPDLLVDPTMGIQETPIYNIDANDYGAIYNENLADDTIIGYRLQSTYDNSQRLAIEVNYYILEYNEFYSGLLSNDDPLQNEDAILQEITLPVSNASDEVPAIAVFFSDVEFKSTIEPGVTYADSCYIYQGSASYTRGYCYLFAYTVDYSANTTSDGTSVVYTYPYDHSDYTGYKNNYGCGTELATTIGKGAAYILNSGMVMAPKAEPEFYAYVYESDLVNGTVTLHYTFDDLDGTISTTTGSETQIEYLSATSTPVYQNINENQIATSIDGFTWYEITLPYDTGTLSMGSEVILEPIVLIEDYIKTTTIDYNEKYLEILTTLSNGVYVEEDHYLTQVPVEYNYGALLTSDAYKDGVDISMDTSTMDENYILFELDFTQIGSSAPLEVLVDRALALKLTFTSEATATEEALEKEFYVTIDSDNYGDTVTFSTALLGEAFLQRVFTVTAEVYYDDGSQGWLLLDEDENGSGLFALQRVNSFDQDVENVEFSSYYVYYNSLKFASSGGLLQLSSSSSFDLSELQGTADGESYVSTKFTYLLNTSYTLTRYLTVGENGVRDNSNTDLTNTSQYYVVPKGVSVYTLAFDGDNSATLNSITPTVGSINENTTVDSIVISSFATYGYSEIDDTYENSGVKEVTVSVYNYNEDTEVSLKEDPVATETVTLNADGTYSTSITLGGTEDNALEPEKQYYLVFSAQVDGVGTVLVDADTSDLAIYSFWTLEGIIITPDDDGIFYLNYDYQTKSLQFTYNLNEYVGIDVTYDIYSSSDIESNNGEYQIINEGTVTPLMSNDSMLASGILPNTSLYYYNSVNINLEPSVNRELLLPGYTYYLKITANTQAGGEDTEVSVILPFNITSIGTIGALIYVEDATSDSLSYLVTLMDSQYSLMSDDKYATSAPYVVRFTDASGNLIKTIYDNEVYYSGNIKQAFTLDSTTITSANSISELSASTYYNMTVYSLLDETNNGNSYPIATLTTSTTTLDESSTMPLSYFFNDTDGTSFTTFINLIDSFWITEGTDTRNNNTDMDVVEDNFAIAERSQITTDEEGLYIETSKAVMTMNGNQQIELMLQESFGVMVDDDPYDDDDDTLDDQYFDYIEYSITGYTSDGIGVSYYGTSVDADGDAMFVSSTNSANYPIYTYTLPQSLEKGSYSITVKLCKDGIEPITISNTYYYN